MNNVFDIRNYLKGPEAVYGKTPLIILTASQEPAPYETYEQLRALNQYDPNCRCNCCPDSENNMCGIKAFDCDACCKFGLGKCSGYKGVLYYMKLVWNPRCPACLHPLAVDEYSFEKNARVTIKMDAGGSSVCPGCGYKYSVTSGTPGEAAGQ